MLLVPGETSKTIHVVNIQVDSITGDLQFSEGGGYFLNPVFRIITPLGLVESQGP